MSSRRPEKPRGGYKLLAVDLDGTLLDPFGEPHAEDLEAIARADDAGIVVSIITGRLYSGTRPTAAKIGLEGPVACADGSHIVRAGDHTTLLHHGLRGESADDLRATIGRADLTTFLFAEDTIVHDARGEEYLTYVRAWSSDIRSTIKVAEDELWKSALGITAVVSLGTETEVLKTVDNIQTNLNGVTQLTTFPVRRAADRWGMVVRAAGGTKGTALEWIARHHGLSLSQAVCVGDWINDVPMLRVAGRSFAMGQAPPDVKAEATDVLCATSLTGGGVAEAVATAFGL